MAGQGTEIGTSPERQERGVWQGRPLHGGDWICGVAWREEMQLIVKTGPNKSVTLELKVL